MPPTGIFIKDLDNGQLMHYQWAEDTGHIIEEGRPNSYMGKQYGGRRASFS